jgi:glycosyltransferase involved in cell wall biosynthesis
MKRSIICVTDYFLPGFRGGGPIRTLANLRELVGATAEIAVFTRDRDLGSDIGYPGIHTDTWLEDDRGPIFYAKPACFGARGLARAISLRRFDLLYLNSFFSLRGSILPLFLRRFSGRRSPLALPILLAPRGEFSPGALALKRRKKRVFIAAARVLGLHRGIHWQASTEEEAEHIRHQFPEAAPRIHLAVDPVVVGPDVAVLASPGVAGQLRIAFISRIAPMKNLDGLLRILAGVRVPVTLNIHGPVEDEVHWQQCRELIARLPGNITVTTAGPLDPDAVSRVFAEHDLFALPTHGENFGHVVFEALRAGTQVLVSDRTPWKTLPSGALMSLPLNDVDGWRYAIEAAAHRPITERLSLRAEAVTYAREYVASSDARKRNIDMFESVAASRERD